MKSSMKLSVLLAGALALSAPFALNAGNLPPGLYFKADVGGNITQDTDLKEFFGAADPGAKVKFHPGGRVAFGVGYDLCSFFGVDGEVGAMENDIRSISGADRVDAVFANIPFLVNARLHGPKSWILSPYIGGGAGVAASVLSIDHIDLHGVSVHGTDSDGVFAYQGFAGLRWAINGSMGLSLEYRFFGTDSPSWRSRDIDSGPDRIRFGNARTHAFSAAFDWSF